MPVRKFRSIEDMKASTPLWRQPGDPELFRSMERLWALGTRTSRRRYPPGLHKHTSIREMERVQATWAERTIPKG